MTVLLNPPQTDWSEATVIAQPEKKPAEPRVLVRRNTPTLLGPAGEQIVYMPGRPVISLFTGIGGMDIGVEQGGFCVVCQHEWNLECCQTLIANRPAFFRNAALIQGDIYQTPTSMLLEEARLKVGECSIVTAGPPCQGFSISNPRAWQRGFDERNDLVFEFLRVVDEAKPEFFMFENVPGFVGFNRGAYLEAFLKRAYGCYYEMVYALLDCSNYGVPQIRVRFICMGTRRDTAECDGLIAALPEPGFFAPRELEHIRMLQASTLYVGELRDWFRSPGIRYFPDRPFLRPPTPTVRGHRSKKYMDFYRRLEAEEPDRLVTAGRRSENEDRDG